MAPKRFRTTDRLTLQGQHLEKEVATIKGKPRVKIGVTQAAFGEPKREAGTPLTLGEVAVVNEFGTENGRIPERSFIRWTHDEYRQQMIRMIDDLRHEVMARRMTTKRALGLVGAEMQRLIKKRIVDIKTPPNAPSTIVAKTRAGRVGDNPLINTGQLLSRILWETYGTS